MPGIRLFARRITAGIQRGRIVMDRRDLSQRPINLLRGWPALNTLPSTLLNQAANKALSDPSIFEPALEYGPDLGYQPLREDLARWLSAFYGTQPDTDRICITGGASQSVACILQSFSDPLYTRRIWLIAPCYHLVCPIFQDAGFAGRLRAVPEDDEGVDMQWLEEAITGVDAEAEANRDNENNPMKSHFPPYRKAYKHVIYAVPSSSNPSGKTMSLTRRKALVQLAREKDALVICDDVYDMLQWHVSPPPSSSSPEAFPTEARLPRLVDIDLSLGPTKAEKARGNQHFGHAISNGSFSKLVGPGVRTGWVEGTPAFALGASKTGSTGSGGAPSQLCAAMVHQMLVSGELDRHLEEVVRPTLRRKHGELVEAICEWPEEWRANISKESIDEKKSVYGGYFVWVQLPKGVDADAVAAEAKKRELVVAPGTMFCVKGDENSRSFKNHVRLCFAWESEGNIREGVARLGKIIGEMLAPHKM